MLPRRLGWLARLFALIGAIPSHVLGGALDHVGLVAFAGLGVWTLMAGILLSLNTRQTGDPDVAADVPRATKGSALSAIAPDANMCS